jgi:predicted nucleic acid-binding protein
VKYTLDTNLFVEGLRSRAAEKELITFLERALPLIFMSAVVMQELAAGARTGQEARELQESLFNPFRQRRRVFAPSVEAFVESGAIVSNLSTKKGPQMLEKRSLLNDALIATSCREQGITLITRDTDFDYFLPFLRGWRHVAPWPTVNLRN